MARHVLVPYDFNGNEVRNVRAHILAADPGSPVEGQFWFNSTDNVLRYFDGTTVISLGAGVVVDFGEAGDIAASDFGDVGDAGSTGESADAGHVHPREANPVTAHEAAGNPHPGYVTTAEGATLITDHNAAADPHAGYQKESEKGAASGYAGLDGAGKVPTAQLPDTVLGSVQYKGVWNASTNTPNISVTPEAGDYYVVSVAGATSLGGITDWKIGDWAIFDGTAWAKVDNTDQVASVFGRQGTVVQVAGDYTAAQVTNTPANGVAGVTVQAAVDELGQQDIDHAAAAHPHAGYARKFAVNCAAAVTTVANHAFNTRDVVVGVHRLTTPWDSVECDVERTDANNVTVRFAVAPAAGDYRIVVTG